ncbi:methyl-accepting chemotaxis protein [Paenibacillus sp. SYP-B3998]|uniref:Methyl-accepting chemotaxis protein n=1 Tax=Paenibacillus sp. SYP-B3998 TaxID=2678564 RepID=A0A6G3ZZY7_9BACL|nr:methyl-accepting chemotaxis protein [Paenibacillus sp. SYP-B3998]
MNIRRKLFSGFAVVLLLTLVVAFIGWKQITSVNKTYTSLIEDRVTKIINVKEIKYATTNEAKNVRGYLITGDEQQVQSYLADRKEFAELSKGLLQSVNTEQMVTLINELISQESEYNQVVQEIISYKKKNDIVTYTRLVQEKCVPQANKMAETAQKLENFQKEQLEASMLATGDDVVHVKQIIVGVALCALLLSCLIAIFMGRIISKPIVIVMEAAKRIAAGDMTVADLQITSKDEIGQMAGSFNTMKRNLRDLLFKINASAEQVADSSKELSVGSEMAVEAAQQVTYAIQEIASSANNQLSSMQENKKAMEESAMGLQRIAESASIAAESSSKALQDAELGKSLIRETITQIDHIRSSVKESVNVIHDLGEHSKQVAQIAGVIGGIAQQTNLLSLNASIEAARAGEHGKGFAVVASEVKKLAEQSKQSSEQIAELLENIVQKVTHAVTVMEKGAFEVDQGSDSVKEAGDAFYEIFSAIQLVTGQVQEVSAATEEISAGTQQMLASEEMLSHLSQEISEHSSSVVTVSQEQFTAMKEVAGSADSLSKLAQELRDEVSHFVI